MSSARAEAAHACFREHLWCDMGFIKQAAGVHQPKGVFHNINIDCEMGAELLSPTLFECASATNEL
jgi:hypothetical protein